ncbi:hypothetical protein [Vibrio alginolyticus]|uniref:hypothetical protein n=1 Tax=Vibrio alginolyticus TaxID=663 RepID=UPI00375419B6
MSKKLLPEKDFLEGLTSHTAHTDEFVTTSEKDWGAYSEGADIDFLVERRDVFDSSRIEFEEDEQDRELVKQRENSPEIDVDIDEL